jgi:hypothetical protein
MYRCNDKIRRILKYTTHVLLYVCLRRRRVSSTHLGLLILSVFDGAAPADGRLLGGQRPGMCGCAARLANKCKFRPSGWECVLLSVLDTCSSIRMIRCTRLEYF